jgi:hypothetical protein
MSCSKQYVERQSLTQRLVPAVLVVIAICCVNCERDSDTISHPFNSAQRLPQPMVSLPFFDRPGTRVNIESAESYHEPLDADSIELFVYRRDTVYHPVYLCHRCQIFIAAYAKSRDVRFLERAERYARKLLSISHNIRGAVYLPYEFRYAVHSDSANTFVPPWYSGMAQGEFLSVLTRLYEFTEDEMYLEVASEVFESFWRPRFSSDIWVVRLDSSNFYWIEEYPHEEQPGMTLNGFIAAVYGIYEYFQATSEPRAKLIYDMSLTTLKRYIPYYLQDCQTSCYCLGHGKEASQAYHTLHIRQMYELYRISGDPYFLEMAKAFESRLPQAGSD